jgi:prepilin-type processing-associated H-X9-DG protein
LFDVAKIISYGKLIANVLFVDGALLSSVGKIVSLIFSTKNLTVMWMSGFIHAGDRC